MPSQIRHDYWGDVDLDWAGYSAQIEFFATEFQGCKTIFLGDEYDDLGDELPMPNKLQLDQYMNTYNLFKENYKSILAEIKLQSYDRYKSIYAKYYESHEEPLVISNPEEHFNYMTDLVCVRISDNGIIRLPIRYKLDEEHGLEIKIQSNKLVEIAGIAET